MRVSVVATGLQAEAVAEPAGEEGRESEAPTRSVFGYTGKQSTPIKKPVQPAPMASRKPPGQPHIHVAPQPSQ